MEQYREDDRQEGGRKRKKSAPKTPSSLWNAEPAKPVTMAEVFPENGVVAAARFDAVFKPETFEENPWVRTARDFVIRTALVTSGDVGHFGIIGQTAHAMPVLQMSIGETPHIFIPARRDPTDNAIVIDDWKDTRKQFGIVSGKQIDPTDVVCHPVVHDKPFSG